MVFSAAQFVGSVKHAKRTEGRFYGVGLTIAHDELFQNDRSASPLPLAGEVVAPATGEGGVNLEIALSVIAQINNK